MKIESEVTMTHIVFFKLKESTPENQDQLAAILNKMQGKMITIAKGNTKIKMLVNTDDEKYRIETRI